MRINVLIITCLKINKEREFIIIIIIIILYYYYYYYYYDWTLRNYAKDGLKA
jgi:hypothetical protein